MSHHLPPPPPLSIILLFSLLPLLPALPANPDPVPITQPFHPNPSQPVTIPSFPEQTALSGCPVTLPDQLYPAVKSSCTGQLTRSECCPVLATWLYSAYSHTALGAPGSSTSETYDMPVLPDDSETCAVSLEEAMRAKGLNLVRLNETCDVIYCYCGIRLHPLSCSQGFRVSDTGVLVGVDRVSKLERDCVSTVSNGTRHRLARCSKCLHSLYSLKKSEIVSGNATRLESRTQKMRGRDCDLMGLTWLLNKDRDKYMPTVTDVMRALMLNSDTSDPISCTLSSDGLPLAVDSTQIDDQSSSVVTRHFSPYLYISPFVSLVVYLSYCCF